MIVNDEYVCKAFDSLGRLNNETKHILNEDKVKEYLLNRFDDSFDIEENARRIKFNIKNIPICSVCGNKCKYVGGKKVYYFCCGDKECFNKIKYDKSKQTFMKNHNGLTSSFQLPGVKEKIDKIIFDKYGVDNIAKSDIAKEKSKQTCLEKYGVEYSFQSKNNKEKSKQTYLEKYGVDNIFKLPEVIKRVQSKCHTYEAKQKQKETCLKKYGVDNYAKTEECKQKISKTCLEKYGDPNYHNKEKVKKTNLKKYGCVSPLNQQYVKDKLGSEDILNKKKQTCLKKYGVEYTSQLESVKNKIFETMKNNGTLNTSKPEINSYNLLKEKYPDTIHHYKDKNRYPFICDFYIPSLDLFIECQYSMFHNKRPYIGNDNDINEVKLLMEKSNIRKQKTGKTKSRYDMVIDTWVNRDPIKRKIAHQNNLNYIEFFTILELINWLNN